MAVKFFIMHGPDQGVILIGVELQPNNDAILRFDPDRAIDDLRLLVDAVSEFLVAVVDESLAQFIGQVGQVSRLKHFAVVGTDLAPAQSLCHQ